MATQECAACGVATSACKTWSWGFICTPLRPQTALVLVEILVIDRPACPAGDAVLWLTSGRTASPAGQAGRGRRTENISPASPRTASPAGRAGRGRTIGPLIRHL